MLILSEWGGHVMRGGSGTVQRGSGRVNYVCGGCGGVILEAMRSREVIHGAYECPACRRLNGYGVVPKGEIKPPGGVH